MKRNLSDTDRIIRIALAALVAILYFTHVISGTLAIILGIVAIALVITSFIKFCPVYWPFGISTWRKNKP